MALIGELGLFSLEKKMTKVGFGNGLQIQKGLFLRWQLTFLCVHREQDKR